MSDHDHKKPPHVWMRNLLLGSAALNVFLAGFIFAKVLAPESTTPGERTRFELTSLPENLPSHVREEVEHQFRVHRKDLEKNYTDLLNARIRVRDLLDDETIDETELREALDEMNSLQIEIQGSIQDALFEAMLEMDPDLRRIFFVRGDGDGERGVWSQRNFDGARWSVEIDNGEIVIDLEGITDRDNDNDNDNNRGE